MKNLLTWPFRMVHFWAWYIKEFTVANVAVLKDIVTPSNDATPGIGRYECHSQTDGWYTLFAALVTTTPGTLVVGAGRDTDTGVRVMYVHSIYEDSVSDLMENLREMEVRMIKGLMIRPTYNKGAK